MVDQKTDVYTFGVFLLELISGKRPVDSSHQSLRSWEYLHLFCDPPVYHVSISSSDIILDFTAKLSHISILPLRLSSSSGSKGSVLLHRNLISKFGALLLELITGQISEKGSGEVVEWVQESHLDVSMHNMIDPDLGTTMIPAC